MSNALVLKRNTTCPYCGRLFSAEVERTREHVIGRKFVPPGTIKADDWNLILGACSVCNNGKSLLEDEISAITLQPEVGRLHSDPALREIAAQKSIGSTSQLTGKKVSESAGTHRLEFALASNATATFQFVAPPQLLNSTVLQLAEAQVQAFFYFVTYDETLKTGRFLPQRLLWSTWTRSLDWGNRELTWFTDLTNSWPVAFAGIAAQGFFKVKLRRMSSASQLGSFALEWNKSLRVVGFFGAQDEFNCIAKTIPINAGHPLDEHTWLREEVPLRPEDDTLFTL